MPRPEGGVVEGTYLVVATIRRPHGIKGELALTLETDRPTLVFRKGRQLLLGDDRGRPVGGVLTVERARRVPDGMLLRAVEFAARTPELEALRGRSLLISAREAAPADADELHYRDLLQAQVLVGDTPLGTIAGITETAAGELLIVRRQAGGELYIPLVRDWIRSFDPAGRRLVIEPPEGLLEL